MSRVIVTQYDYCATGAPPEGNEPAGFTQVLDSHFEDFSAWFFVGGGADPSEGEASIINGTICQFRYATGYVGGTEPDRVVTNIDHGPWQYFRATGVGVSGNWYGHGGSGVNKFVYYHNIQGTQLSYIDFHGSANDPLYVRITTQNTVEGGQVNIGFGSARNNSTAPQSAYEIVRGELYTVESLFYPGTGNNSDGVIKIWLDGTLIIDIDDLNHDASLIGTPPNTTRGLRIAPVYGGGTGFTVPEEQFMYVDRFYISEGTP